MAANSMLRPIAFSVVVMMFGPGSAGANYNPESCRLVAGSLDIHWEAVAGSAAPCTAIEFTDGTVEDAADGSVSMSGTSVSNEACTSTFAYEFTLSADGRTLTGSDTSHDIDMVLTREPGEGCFHGHWISGVDDYVAHIAGDVFAAAAEPICGDVNDTGTVNTTDALLVLKKGVGQNVSPPCGRYGNILDDCEFALSTCQSAPVCGDGVVGEGEDCDVEDLDDQTCVTRGFAGGTLGCSFCAFDTSGCYATRFDASGATILDHQTGLEWEKKISDPGSGTNYADPHDVDNAYTWTSASLAANGTAFSDFLAKLNGVSDGICYLGHCDWRLPTILELQSLAVDGCDTPPCVVDPVFLPTRSDFYWSSTTNQNDPSEAWVVSFFFGGTGGGGKTFDSFVRAVRSGS